MLPELNSSTAGYRDAGLGIEVLAEFDVGLSRICNTPCTADCADTSLAAVHG